MEGKEILVHCLLPARESRPTLVFNDVPVPKSWIWERPACMRCRYPGDLCCQTSAEMEQCILHNANNVRRDFGLLSMYALSN